MLSERKLFLWVGSQSVFIVCKSLCANVTPLQQREAGPGCEDSERKHTSLCCAPSCWGLAFSSAHCSLQEARLALWSQSPSLVLIICPWPGATCSHMGLSMRPQLPLGLASEFQGTWDNGQADFY